MGKLSFGSWSSDQTMRWPAETCEEGCFGHKAGNAAHHNPTQPLWQYLAQSRKTRSDPQLTISTIARRSREIGQKARPSPIDRDPIDPGTTLLIS